MMARKTNDFLEDKPSANIFKTLFIRDVSAGDIYAINQADAGQACKQEKGAAARARRNHIQR